MANAYRVARLRRRRVVLRRQKTFKRVVDPLNGLTDEDIFCRYRFRRETIMFLVTLLSPVIQYHSRKSMAVSPLIQVLVTLRFLATGSFYRLVGDSLGLSIASVARSVDRVTSAVCRLSRTYIKFPTGQYLSDTKKKFFELAGFPQVAGCIDGTFIRIIAPSENEQDYVNRKGYHSLNVQMTCDASYRITNCVAKWPGSVHDSRMFKHSHLCQKFENGTYKGILLGDSAYPCRKFIMTPYMDSNSNSKIKFNKSLCRTRVTIEQTFGILKRRFSCLHSGLRLNPEKAACVVLACATLHNIGIERRDIFINETFNENILDDIPNQNQIPIGDGEGMRDLIRQTYFS